MDLDTSTRFGARVAERLQSEHIIWLTTVRADGSPQPSPVWFLWNGETLLVFSEPDKPKLRNITANPHVALNFNSNEQGGDIVIIGGEAHIVAAVAEEEVAAYLEKYRDSIARIGHSPDTFGHKYSVALYITPSRLRGF